jgi:hypothetical protein
MAEASLLSQKAALQEQVNVKAMLQLQLKRSTEGGAIPKIPLVGLLHK